MEVIWKERSMQVVSDLQASSSFNVQYPIVIRIDVRELEEIPSQKRSFPKDKHFDLLCV